MDARSGGDAGCAESNSSSISPDQLLQHIFDGDYAGGRAEFVDHYGEMAFALLEFREKIGQRLGLGNHQHLAHDVAHFEIAGPRDWNVGRGAASQAIAHPAHEVLGIEHADDVLGAALRIIDRDARVLLVDHLFEGLLEGHVAGQGEDVAAAEP